MFNKLPLDPILWSIRFSKLLWGFGSSVTPFISWLEFLMHMLICPFRLSIVFLLFRFILMYCIVTLPVSLIFNFCIVSYSNYIIYTSSQQIKLILVLTVVSLLFWWHFNGRCQHSSMIPRRKSHRKGNRRSEVKNSPVLYKLHDVHNNIFLKII